MAMPDTPRPVAGFVGLGNMGMPMAGRLVDAGYQVLGFDVDPAARGALRDRGGTDVASAAEVARGADVVILMLPDSNVVDAVATDPSFVAALEAHPAGRRGVVVDMSSSEPERTRELACFLGGHGVAFVDAPVSGGVTRARSGQLAVMTGGTDADVERVRAVLEQFGTVYRAGPVGAGHAVKALNNLMSAAHLLVTSEAMLAGQEFGLDPAAMLAIFNVSSGRSGSTENKWPAFILPETFDSGFGLRLMLKDMRIALGLAEQMKRPSRLGARAAALWAEAAEALPPTADHTEIARWLRATQAADAPAANAQAAGAPGTSQGDDVTLTARQEEIKAQFIEVRGTWGDTWETILRLDPEFLLGYLNFSAVPWRQNHLPDKVKEFIYIAVDANATHMYLPGVRQHIKAALALGATGPEIMEVLELAATLGIHAMNIGVPILVQVLAEKGLRTGPAPLTGRQEEIKADFTKARGYWHEFWDDMLELDPELLASYTEFSSVPWRSGPLEPKVKELIYIAFDTAATHLYTKGLKAHIENAIGYGATAGEILEVMEIASVLGIHGVTTAAPILAEELAAQEKAAQEEPAQDRAARGQANGGPA